MATRTICSDIFNGELFKKRTVKFDYSPYLAPYLSYQYPGESIVTLDADDYTLQQQNPQFTGGQCTFVYNVFARIRYVQSYLGTCPQYFSPASATATDLLGQYWGPIYSLAPATLQTAACGGYSNIAIECHGARNGARSPTKVTVLKSMFVYNAGAGILEITNVKVTPYFGQSDNCGNLPSNCDFKAYKNGQLVYSESRNVCPTVVVYPCQNRDKYSTTINLNPYEILFLTEGGTGTSEIAEQIQFYLNSILLGGSELAQQIANLGADFVEDLIDGQPDNCLLLWNFSLDKFPYFNYISQICSYETCPQPEYTTDCQTRSCPDGTCEVICSDKTCCYGSDGKAVEVLG